MKFAHISDTHLGFSQFGTGERAKDVYNAFLQAIDISIKEKVEFVVFAGDIFHTPTPDGTAIINMAHALKKLQDVQIPAYFILGEHDISHAMLHPVSIRILSTAILTRLCLPTYQSSMFGRNLHTKIVSIQDTVDVVFPSIFQLIVSDEQSKCALDSS